MDTAAEPQVPPGIPGIHPPPLGPFNPGPGDGSPASVLIGSESWRGRLSGVETFLKGLVEKMEAWWSKINDYTVKTDQRLSIVESGLTDTAQQIAHMQTVTEKVTNNIKEVVEMEVTKKQNRT